MSQKFLWTGLTLMLAASKFLPTLDLAGSVVMLIGAVLLILDK